MAKSFITKGVPVVERPDVLQIDLYGSKARLIEVTNGNTKAHHISKKVAAVLIANGMSYGA